MEGFFIHIGAPRTASTTLQGHIFNHSTTCNLFCKEPYKPTLKQKRGIANNPTSFHKPLQEGDLITKRDLFERICHQSIFLTQPNCSPIYEKLLIQSIRLSIQTNQKEKILFSTERLSDTSASLNGECTHKLFSDKEFPIFPLTRTLKKIGINPTIIVCLRSPIQYLRSKYARTILQLHRSQFKNDLSPNTFIENQIALEKEIPGTSALTPAIHKNFISKLNAFSKVHAFGFNELTRSSDVFNLLGISGERKIPFHSAPVENKISNDSQWNYLVESEIIESLKKNHILEEIISNRLH